MYPCIYFKIQAGRPKSEVFIPGFLAPLSLTERCSGCLHHMT